VKNPVKHRRLVGGTIACALLAAPLLAGCDGNSDSSATKPPATAGTSDPKTTLAAATPDRTQASYAFTANDQQSKYVGQVDPAKKAGYITSFAEAGPLGTGTANVLVTESDAYLKVSFTKAPPTLKLPTQFSKVDPTKIKDKGLSAALNDHDGDPMNLAALVAAASAVKVNGTSYTGTVDLGKVPDASGMNPKRLAALADHAKAVPFTAKLDSSNRITSFELAVPDAPNFPGSNDHITLNYQPVHLPTAGAANGNPAVLYQLFNLIG